MSGTASETATLLRGELRGATPNPEPWSDERPRILCTCWDGNRVVLQANGDLCYERRRPDSFGVVAWVEKGDWFDIADNVNLDFNPWIRRLDASALKGAFLMTDTLCVALTAEDVRGGRFLFIDRANWCSYHRASITKLPLSPPNAWIFNDPNAKNSTAARDKASLAYRYIGGDPSVRLELVPL